MVTHRSIPTHRLAGYLITEVIVALAVIALALLPIMGTYAAIQKSLRRSYQHAIAMELVDGEMEILLAGEWRDYSPGAHPYTLHGNAVTNLPPGKTVLTVSGNRLQLEWSPARPGIGGKITREALAR